MRRLLMAWDPIGVSDIPEAADEYDCMISPLLHLLFEGADARSLADWIRHERSSHFGLRPDDARHMQLAEWFTAWWNTRRTTTAYGARTQSGHESAPGQGQNEGRTSEDGDAY